MSFSVQAIWRRSEAAANRRRYVSFRFATQNTIGQLTRRALEPPDLRR
jgi:hypothetical protein